MPYYAVAKGRSTGIYKSWGDCESQVKGFSGASFKKFDSAASAESFVHNESGGGSAPSSRAYSQPSYGGSSTGSTSYTNYDYGNNYQSFVAPPQPRERRSTSDFVKDNDGYVQVYTDGACANNGREGARAGLGVYWGDGHRLNTSEPVSGRPTNNSGEIQAATRAIKQARENGVTKLTINTDSQFLIDSATKWMPDWKQNGWKRQSGEPVKNERDFKELDARQQQVQVKWNHIEAHRGDHGNEMADQLAKAGASKYNKR